MGTTYYVSAAAPTNGDGLSPDTAFGNLQYAADLSQPGDIIYVMNGTYTNPECYSNVLTITRSGLPDQWITYQAYPGHHPKLQSQNWHGICVQGAAYIRVEGFEIEGNSTTMTLQEAIALQSDLSNPRNSGNGIGVTPSLDGSKRSHHIVICNNNVHNNPGGGIYTRQADYVQIEGNTVYENAWFSPWGCSGISLFQNWNSDDSTATKMIVRNNTVWGNYNYIPFWMIGRVTDGNGIIVDDSSNSLLGSPLGAYQGHTLISDNRSYSNGGLGIATYRSANVDLTNNQCWNNALHPAILARDPVQSTYQTVQQGTDASDRLIGRESNDTLSGGRADDVLIGKSGNDVLIGGEGNDVLVGGEGNDVLRGGRGTNRLSGGQGNDRFVLDIGSGCNLITGFNVSQDRLVLPVGVSVNELTVKTTGKRHQSKTLVSVTRSGFTDPLVWLVGSLPKDAGAQKQLSDRSWHHFLERVCLS